MPTQLTNGSASRKRKKTSGTAQKEAKIKVAESRTSARSTDNVLQFEQEIVESPQNYNKIITLLEYIQGSSDNLELAVASAVSLCRAFCRLMAERRLSHRKGGDGAQAIITRWLNDRYREYVKGLSELISHEQPTVQTTALTLLMRLVKVDGTYMKPVGDEFYFPHALFTKVVKALLYAEHLNESVRKKFSQKYINKYDDIRYSFYTAVLSLTSCTTYSPSPVFTSNILSLMLSLENPPTTDTPLLESTYITPPSSPKKQPPIHQKSSHRKLLQETWLAVLRLPLSKDHLKAVLGVMSNRIVPTFTRPQMLMDFLVGAYDAGGSISLLALNGLFYLISTKNLDYPNFYQKLYALLTRDVLHVRYRSRFFRLLDIFLSSTHIPAAMVASFIKRIARLSLCAPPATVVIVVPFIYNLLKKHPSCTFMVHREGSVEDLEEWRREGLGDCFDEMETNPMKTRAIESCLWEVEMLMAHWHPNVGTLARIVQEQFTKETYVLEDFLDHSYASMFDAEINKIIKKPPVVEYDIPKKIFFRGEEGKGKGDDEQLVTMEENILLSLWCFE